jgi:HSP20 family molecular chaperone IbpA
MREEAERTPVAEVTASPRRFYVTVEIPGASQDTIQIAATPSVLRIHAPLRGGAAYRIEVALPARVDPESVKVTYRNGVLDVAMSRSARRGGEGRER